MTDHQIRARMEVEKEIDTRIDIAREQTLQKDRERLQKEKEDLLAKQLDINKLVEEKAKELEVSVVLSFLNILECS